MNLTMARQFRVPGDTQRGLELAFRHCESLDPDSPSARERLEREIGARCARFLVDALCARPAARHGSGLGFVA
jgi:hypothetical protein